MARAMSASRKLWLFFYKQRVFDVNVDLIRKKINDFPDKRKADEMPTVNERINIL